MLDIVDGGLRVALGPEDDTGRHLIGRETRVTPDGRHHRNVDVRKDIGGSAEYRKHPEQGDGDGEYQEGIRAP